MKKVLVTKEWRERAMKAIESENANFAFIEGLRCFLITKLTPEQQKELDMEVQSWMDAFDENKVN
ncbi:hypothetical protein PVK64_19395 [Aliivibrio sp. S4TY2]|uniref:hypothetical protein n=1 Tax=unclassified Aliivibrio TaxID=2645654 RepID=UPI0023798A66|nr:MULTISPECIES: hypothetical protein [unclassified Aliivibrio]MDD9158333.1 hypothetical protein [Aliivibrio sp. S4TY2]MDD9162303.1 hypothetical protein [Aliivibrio sp. S4TY1]MDD9166341.1 hypothetical protein [Aliivibrio sp. S4MY2]MDD9170339.1 hypothetical protein [Aliivibrio sp. S4MY4]MDD9187390.1 hypothetical protein [Aliivibrio sp. S4MY3]